MRCPFCSSEDTQVKDSRQAEDNTAVRRRRLCGQCAGRFTTFERVQLRELMVVKKSGRRTPFDRDKLARSVLIALQKRPVDPERVEQMISGIVRQLESAGNSDIQSDHIGALVMEGLAGLDKVAYVRYASVYKDFRAAQDFETFIEEERLDSQNPGIQDPDIQDRDIQASEVKETEYKDSGLQDDVPEATPRAMNDTPKAI